MQPTHRTAGFTLIELMITVAIVAILASIAFASYRNQIIRSNRSAAQSFMFDVASRQERYLLDFRSYAPDLTTLRMSAPPEVSNNYNVTVSTDTTVTTPNYIIAADPKDAQDRDDTSCGKVTLNQLGTKSSEFNGANCWR